MNMLKSLAVAALLACFSFAIAPAAMAKESAEEFVRDTAVGNQFEILSSQLALEKSKNNNVRNFAQHMINDHSKAGEDLKATLKSSTVDATQVTDTLDSKHQKIYNKLKAASASSFDRKYISAQKKAHDETVKLFRKYAKKGEDPALKDFAVKTLPTLEAHKQEIKQLKS
jgi:putative membrane protein